MPHIQEHVVSVKQVDDLIRLTAQPISYNPTRKRAFHKLAKAVMQALVTELGFPDGTYSIRYNPGGVAVSGETILHSDDLYVMFSQTPTIPAEFMWRTCNGRADYRGDDNRWTQWARLRDIEAVAKMMLAAIADKKARPVRR